MTDLSVLPIRPPPATSLQGEWLDLYQDTLSTLLAHYARKGPQYAMLAEMAANLYTQTRRMEADGAVEGNPRTVALYLQAVESLRKIIGQAQLYTEARRQEIVVSEVNSAVVQVLQIVETMVEPTEFSRIVSAVQQALDA